MVNELKKQNTFLPSVLVTSLEYSNPSIGFSQIRMSMSVVGSLKVRRY